MMAGIYCADYDKLSLQATFPMFAALERKHGSVMRGLVRARQAAAGRQKPPPMFMSLRNGMQSLVDRLQTRLTGTLMTGVRATELQRRGDQFTCFTSDGSELEADAVLLALPPAAAADLLGETTNANVSTAELAVWTSVARVLMNLDEFITRE